VKRELRNIDGLLILDKPSGPTSNRILQQVKHLLRAAKAGHTGALDPLASGVLPLCFGEATKVSQFLLDSDKAYRARVKLGITTATGDSEGEVLATAPVPAFSAEQIEAVLAKFRGVITQQPSVYSALKQNGVPLYQLAREGKEITPKFRDVTIYSLQLLAHDGDELDIEVSCSKGTYVRTLAEDIGKALGTGAHLTALRRLKAGPFTLAQSFTIEQVSALAESGELDAKLLRPDLAIADLPAVQLDAAQAQRIRQGQLVRLGPVAALDGRVGAVPDGAAPDVRVAAVPDVRVYAGEEFVGIGELRADGMLAAKRLMKY
jgi:tRNA pseudouridine55 synthase